MRLAHELRRAGYQGQVQILSAEHTSPYDRPPLSKEVLKGQKGPDDIRLQGQAFYEEQDIQLCLGMEAIGLDVPANQVVTTGGLVAYDNLVIATGLRPRRLPGLESSPRVHTIRTLDDAIRLRGAIRPGGHALVVGAGFIGCEAAASLKSMGMNVTIVEPNSVPLQAAAGAVVGELVARLHRGEGIDLRTNVSVLKITESTDGLVVELSDGTAVHPEIVVLGIGSAPELDWLRGTGVEVGNGIICDSHGRTSEAGIWAMGDVSLWRGTAQDRRVEHWTRAGDQACHVAAQIAGTPVVRALPEVDYVWSDQYDLRIQILGHIEPDAVPHVIEDDGRRFLVAFTRHDRIVAVAGAGMARKVMQMRSAILRSASLEEVVPG